MGGRAPEDVFQMGYCRCTRVFACFAPSALVNTNGSSAERGRGKIGSGVTGMAPAEGIGHSPEKAMWSVAKSIRELLPLNCMEEATAFHFYQY